MKAYRNHFFVLILLWLLTPTSVLAAVCDADDDSDIDYDDITLISQARNTPASGPDDPRDADRDGVITVLDARTCLYCILYPESEQCVIIDPPNTPPTIVSAPATTATEGLPYSYDVDANDPDAGDVLTYSLVLAPAGMTIDPTSGLIQWTPTGAQLGDNSVQVRAADAGGLADTQSFTVNVVSSNSPPVIVSAPATTATEGLPYSYDVDANDPDAGDVLTYSLVLAPAGMTIDPTSGLIQWTPTGAQLGDNSVQVRAADAGGLADTQSFAVNVVSAPPVDVPTISVGPDPLDFGDVFVGSSANLPLVVANTGDATLSVSGIGSSGAPFDVFPPLSFDIAAGAAPRNVDIDFSPTSAGIFNGTITLNSNADNQDPVEVAVTGRGVEATPDLAPDIDTSDSVDFGTLAEGGSVEQLLTISNTGDAPLDVDDVTSDSLDFVVGALPGQSIPFTLDPGNSQNVSIVFTAPSGSADSAVTAQLTIDSNDPDESPKNVALSADVTPVVALVNIPILGASVDDVIDDGNCSNVLGSVQFANHAPTFLFNVTLTDQGGTSVTSPLFSSESGAEVGFNTINACALDDGILELSVSLGSFPPFIGTPAIKNPSTLPAPILDPVAGASVLTEIEVCGTSRESTTVKIEGGANTVSVQLDALTTDFCLDVPLRPNTENTLIATAIDNIAAPPRPSASAPPVQVTHVDPSAIIIAEASSRPLTIEETELLVQNGVIDLDDPTNFNVSMFTIVLTIGQFPVTVSQPVAVPTSPGVSYGSSGGSGWSGGGGGGGVPVAPRPVTGCTSGCSSVVVIKTPTGQTIPGVIIIDGRIKTLKEFFQVTIAIQNTSAGFVLSDMQANILLPPGLSPVRAGPGTDVSDINTGGEIDNVVIGDIGPMSTGTGQFIIRGDGIGTHNVDVEFDGFLTGGGLPAPEPVNGSAGTSVQVFGPPTFDVVVRHPSDPGGDDVVAGEIYDLIVEITNTSSRPALYTSLELFVGGQATLVDEFGVDIPDSNEIISFGHIPAGRAVSAAFRVRSSLQGEIIACQAIASENISLTVDTGIGTPACNIANTYPANFEPLPADQAPVVIGINPLNGQPNIPVTTSVFATLTPQSACIVGDTFTNVVVEDIDPTDPTKGLQVVAFDLVDTGTFYLEELDTFGNPVRHIPTDLTVENPPAGGTTIAVLRLGLDAPHPNSQYFLKDNTTYRATLVGGAGGICSDASGAEMLSDFTWTFSTEQTCNVTPPIATMGTPPDGSIDRPLNQPIVLDFTNRMNPASFAFLPGDLLNSTFSVYENAVEDGGEISGGSPVPGSGVFSNLNRTLTYTPLANFAEDVPVHIRLTDGLRDICGNPLQAPPSGVQLLSFQTIPPDTTAPAVPVVNPVPAFTNLATVQVSGEAEAGSTVTVSGGSLVKTATASGAGLFSVSVPLNFNLVNDFLVQATDASGNPSALADTDINGFSLTTIHDNVLPQVISVSPTNGASDVGRNVVVEVEFDEALKADTINEFNFTLEGSVIPGTLTPVGDSGFSFSPDNLLDYNKTYNIRIRANGMRDLSGNGLSSEFVASFTTQNFPLPIITDLTPNDGVQGTNFAVTFTGSELVTAFEITSDNPGISGAIVSTTDTAVVANITIDALAATGATTLGLTTLGGNLSTAFNVLHKAPIITDIVPDNGDQGTTVDAQIQGSGLTDITDITIDGTGVTVVDLGTGSDALRNVQFVIDPAATPGLRSVTVTTPGGSDSDDFTVLVPVVPVLTSVTPDNGEQNSSFSVTFTGTDLADVDAIVSADPEVTGSVVSTSDTSVVANITVSALATVGATTISVVAPGGTSNALPFTVTAALEQITLSPVSLNLQTLTSGNLNVSISIPAGVGGQVISLASSDTTVATVPASVTIPQGNSSTSFTVTTLSTAGTATITASAGGFDPDSSQINVSARGMSFNLLSPFIGVGRTANASIALDQPAPSGGVTVNLATGNTSIATVNPGSVFIPQGTSTASFDINGLVIGTTPLTATASGFTTEVENIIVTSSNVINFGLIPDVAPGESASLPTSLGQPAPAGGLTINFTSSNPSVATVTASVFIPEGLQVPAANPQITGVTLGSALITGTASGFAPDSRFATVTLDSSFSPGSLSVIESQSGNITLVISAPAPAGGLTFNLSTDDGTVATVPATATVGAGQTSVQIPVTGVAVGSTTLRANTAGLSEATAAITVNPMPAINIGNTNVGKDLQIALSGSLGLPAPTGGVQLTVTSSDATKVLLSNSRTAAGSASITLNVNAGSTFIPAFYVQSLVDTGTVTLTTTATGYATDTSSVTSAPSGFWFNAGNFTRDVFAANFNLQLRSARLAPGTLTRAQDQEVRGGISVSVDLTNSDDTVGTLTADPVVFNGGVSVAANTAFDPASAGATTIAIVQPTGFDEPSNVNTSIVATVTAPNINMGNATVGKDLQQAVGISLSNAPPTPVDVTVTIADASVALLSSSRTAVGSNSVTFSGVTGTSVGTVYVQGLAQGSTQMTVQAAAYNDDVNTVTVNPSGFWFNAGNFTRDVFAANFNLQLRSARLAPGTLTRAQDQEVRGGISVSVDLTNSDDTVGTLTADPVVFNGGVSVAANTAFDPLLAGTTTIAIVQPTGFDEPSNVNTSIVATVTAPNINMGNATVGKDLQQAVGISLSNAPPTPVDVTVTIADASVALLSSSRTAVGSNSVTFSGVTGTSVGTVYVQGLAQGSTQMTVQAAAYNDDVNTVTVNPSGFWFNAGNFTRDVFAANLNLQLRSARLAPGTLTRAQDQEVRGGISVSVDLTNSDDTVGTLTVDPVVFNGGVSVAANTAFDPASAGATTIAIVQPSGFDIPSNVNTSIVATVTAPNINMGNATVGKDLQQAVNISLSNAPPSPVDVTVTIAASSIALLSSDRSAAGSSSVTFSGVSGTSVGTVYVQGLALGSTQMTVQAAGYNDDTNSVTVNPSGFWFNANNFTRDIFASNLSLQMRSARLTPGTLTRAQDQEVRGGHSVSVDLTNSDDTVGTLTVNPVVFNGGVSVAANTGFDPLTVGTSTIAIVQPSGFDIPSNVNTSIVATVIDPSINMGDANVGKDLQQAVGISLSNAPPSPVDVTVTIADASVALVSNSRTVAGSSTVTFSGVTGASVGTVYIQGLAQGSTQMTVQAAAYNDDVNTITVNPSGFWFNANNFTRSASASNLSLQVRASRLNPGTLTRSADQEVRGGHSVNVDLTNSDDTVGTLTVDPVVFNGGVGVAANTAFDPASAGVTTIGISQPTGFDIPSNVNTSLTATVTP